MRALAGREDVFAEIESIDVGPYSESSPFRLCIREAGVTVEVGMGIFENSFPQREEPIDPSRQPPSLQAGTWVASIVRS